MPAKRVTDVKHPPIEWRGFTLLQWLGTARTAALRGGNSKNNEPQLSLAVKYLKGNPVTYDATITMAGAACSVFNFDDPCKALDEANERIQRLAAALVAAKS